MSRPFDTFSLGDTGNPPICRSRKIARHTPTCICHSVLYSFSFLIPVSSFLRIPTYKRTIRAYCRTYTLPTRRNRAWLTFSFVHQYIFKRSLPERNHSGGWKNYIYPSDLELYFILCPIGTGRIVLVVSWKTGTAVLYCRASWRSNWMTPYGRQTKNGFANCCTLHCLMGNIPWLVDTYKWGKKQLKVIKYAAS